MTTEEQLKTKQPLKQKGMKQTAKEKAIELVDKMYETSISTVPVTRGEAKKLAKISINETIIMLQYANVLDSIGWLKAVKREINKL